MTEPEYSARARKFLVDSDREFDAGARQQASEKLYRAANAALTAIAVRRGWPHHTHRDLKSPPKGWLMSTIIRFSSAGLSSLNNFIRTLSTTKWRTTKLRPTAPTYIGM